MAITGDFNLQVDWEKRRIKTRDKRNVSVVFFISYSAAG